MSLPSKVQQIGDAAEQQAVESGIKPGSKPAPAEPANKPDNTKVDPDNWSERYKRYKADTDNTISNLRQTLAEVQTTLAEVQNQNSELIQKLVTAPAPAAAADTPKPADPKNDETAFETWLNGLPQKYKDDYTEDYLRDQFYFLQTMPGQQAAAAPDNLHELETKVDSIVEFQEKTAQQKYEDTMDEAYPDDGWISMTKEPEWGDFCARTVSPVDRRTYGQIVKAGNETHDATSVIWVLGQYQKYKTDLDATDNSVVDTRETLLTPEGGGGGDAIEEINANTETYTASQVQRFYQDRTKGKYSDEEFKAIEQSILRAQAAGKITQG